MMNDVLAAVRLIITVYLLTISVPEIIWCHVTVR
jgi:hypothetical protein